jgi:uncharacterized membrane-anchored protein YhcB (DUF1043 family)
MAQEPHWRDRLIAKSEAISDAWQVALAYAGRAAEIILFVCMFINIVEMVPTIHVWDWLSNGTLIVQMITLDVAGFSLNSMAKHVRRGGDEETAKKAEDVGRILISIMVISLINVTIKLLFGSVVPHLSTYLGYVDDVLILARVVATVFYGHVIHSLREAKQYIQEQKQEQTEDLQAELERLRQTLQTERQQTAALQKKWQADLQAAREDFRLQLAALQQSQQMTLTTAENQTSMVSTLQSQLQEALQQVRYLSDHLDQKQRELDAQTARLQTTSADLQAAKTQMIDLQNQLREAKLRTAKLSTKTSAQNITSFDQARAKHEAAGSSRAKVSYAEILAFKAAHPEMKNADVAAQLGVSERKVYDALAWQRDQQSANAEGAAQ